MRPIAAAVIFILFIAIYSYVLTNIIPKKFYSLVNIITALVAIIFGLSMGISLGDMGLALPSIPKGIALGFLVSLPVIVAVVVGVFIPKYRHFFSDGPKKQPHLAQAMEWLFIRIPFGTAMSEEVLFRGVLLGLILQNATNVEAIIVSSIVFGLWHIMPTLDTIKNNDAVSAIATKRKNGHLLPILITVVATFFAGLVFALLRVKSGSMFAPWILHISINGATVAGGYALMLLSRKKAKNTTV